MGLTLPCGASARESGMSSAKTIQVMQPAANPRARGNKEVNVSTNMKEGTASRGWGRAVNRAHQNAFLALTPLDTKTVATARPSGMLCSPIAKLTSTPYTANMDKLVLQYAMHYVSVTAHIMVATAGATFQLSAPATVHDAVQLP